jgi:signal transduction histidine kinase/HAMP domain-containing protein
MTIRTRLRLKILFTVVAALIAIAVMAAANNRVDQERARIETVQTILQKLLFLDSLTLEYLMRPGARAEVQWKAARDEIGKQLRALAPSTPEGATILEPLNQDYERSNILFDQLTALAPEAERTAGREVLSGQLQLKIRSQVSGVLQLLTLMRQQSATTQKWAYLILVILSVTLVALITGSSLLFGRSILIPLDALRKGMEIVGAGDLEHRVGLATSDEIGDVSRAFDRMVENLKQVEEALRRLNRELRAISDCNQALMRAEDEQTLLNDICDIVCNEAGYRMVFVAYAENDEAKTIRPMAWAGVEEGYLEQARLTWADTERGRGPVGTAVRSGESACVQDFTCDLQARPWRDNALQRGYRSVIALPLKDESANTFGILAIYSTQPNAFNADEIRLLEELAGDLAFGVIVLRARIEHKQAEEEIAKLDLELQRQLEALEQAKNELEAISYSVSHDLKIPLRAIDGFASMLRDEYKSQLAGEGERYLEVVLRNTVRMGHLIDSLQDFISLSQWEIRLTPVDLGALAQEVFEQLRTAAPERNIRLCVGDLPPARCDRDLIRRALAGLLDNAIKFTAPCSEAFIEIGGVATDAGNTYFMRDNGVGFDMRYLNKLFGVGLRLHSPDEFEGSGIGLAIVKRIISRHGGSVWAEGRVDEGATVHFTLPAIQTKAS